jgi:hypothetical protein
VSAWLAEIEKHVSFGFILCVCTIFLKNHRLFIRAKERLNDLWWDRCAEKQEPYTPVENGTPAVVPPRPQ